MKLSELIEWIDCISSCSGKVQYGHRETAEQAVKEMEQKGVSGLEPYPCRHGDHWHIGH